MQSGGDAAERIDTLLGVAAGGALGAGARWAVGTQAEFSGATSFPWHTLAVNVVGCVLIGLAAARLDRGGLAWGFVVTGLLGGFTTMSAFAVELNDLADAGRTSAVVVYLVATLTAGVAAVVAGERIGERHRTRREAP